MLRVLSLVFAAFLLCSGALVMLQPDALWMVERPDEAQESPLLPWQHGSERWFVVLVEFPDQRSQSTGIGLNTASNILENEVLPYMEAASGGDKPEMDLHPSVYLASQPAASYGEDTSKGRDMSSDGTFLPADLALEVIDSIVPEAGWPAYDLNNDGTVDRFLLLHTARGQEADGSKPNLIWSHFTRLMEPPSHDGVEIGHYTMATLRGGTDVTGTIVHEMLHQLGAVDLYPVHDPSWAGSWHGPGDWDVMASGNWNGQGSWPALPTAATSMRTGLQEPVWLDLDFPVQRDGPCLGPEVSFNTSARPNYAVALTEDQSLHIEWVGGNVYDDHLPGQGVLVTVLDAALDDERSNEVNVDPGRPYLYVVEADDDRGLRTGSDDGVASDAFQVGDRFGAEGILVHDHRGVRVPWTAEIVGDASNPAIRFSAPSCGHGLTLEAPSYASTVLTGEAVPLTLVNEDAPCTLEAALSFDLGGLAIIEDPLLDTGSFTVMVSPTVQVQGDAVDRLNGTLTCGATVLHLDRDVVVVNRRPQASSFVEVVAVTDPTSLVVPISSSGSGSSTYTILVDGPLDRVIEIDEQVRLEDDTTSLSMTIEPRGLLLDGMLVRGTLILVDVHGTRTLVDVELTAGEGADGSVFGLPRPLVVGGLMMLLGASLLLPRKVPSAGRPVLTDVQNLLPLDDGSFRDDDQAGHDEWTATFPPPSR